MKILIVYARQHVGFDPVIPLLTEALRVQRPLIPTSDPAPQVKAYEAEEVPEEVYDTDWDMVLLLDSLAWMMTNRLRLMGRPWVCIVSFTFASLTPYMKMPIADTGVHAIFSNCPAFVTQSSQQVPAVFTWKPVELNWRALDGRSRTVKAGTVLPNIEDRDFSVLCEAADVYKSTPKDFAVYVRYNDKQRTPKELADFIVPYRENEEISAFQSIDYFLCAPRITDYRAGVVPPEILRAAVCGCQPVLVYHPALDPLKQVLQPMCHSFVQLKALLISTTQENMERQITVTLPDAMLASVGNYAERLMVGYHRWRVNASA